MINLLRGRTVEATARLGAVLFSGIGTCRLPREGYPVIDQKKTVPIGNSGFTALALTGPIRGAGYLPPVASAANDSKGCNYFFYDRNNF